MTTQRAASAAFHGKHRDGEGVQAMSEALLVEWLGLLTLALAGVALLARLELPTSFAYIMIGLLTGPAALGWFEGEPVDTLSAFGGALLLFGIGLELSITRGVASRRLLFGLGGAEILLCVLLVPPLAWLFGTAPMAASIVGCALACSSSVIVFDALVRRGEWPTEQGRIVSAVLASHAFAAVLVLSMLPALAAGRPDLSAMVALAFVCLYLLLVSIGPKTLSPAMEWIGAGGSSELVVLAALLVASLAFVSSHLLDLAPAVGAFLAGIALGGSMVSERIAFVRRHLGDLLRGPFFVAIGMQIDLAAVVAAWPLVATLLLVLVVYKAGVVFVLARAFGYGRQAAWRAGLLLAQGGELGLLLVTSGAGLGLVDHAWAQAAMAAIVASLVISPILSNLVRGLTDQSAPNGDADYTKRDQTAQVIICGFGRIGQNLAVVLRQAGIGSLALDLDAERVREARAGGEAVVYGDATRPGVLRAAGLDQARALAVTFDDPAAARKIVGLVRLIDPALPILVRGVDPAHADRLREAGVDVVQERLEIGLLFAARLLALTGVPLPRSAPLLDQIRGSDYAPLRDFYHDFNDPAADINAFRSQRRTLTLAGEGFAAGRTPDELGLCALGVELVEVRRRGTCLTAPLADARLCPGDNLVLKGPVDALERARARLIEGA